MNESAAPAEPETAQEISISVAAPVESKEPPAEPSPEIPAETAVLAAGEALGAAVVATAVAEAAKDATQEAAADLSAAVSALVGVTTTLAEQVSRLEAIQTVEALEPQPQEPIVEPIVEVKREPPKKGRSGLAKFIFG